MPAARHAQLRGAALWARISLGELTLEQVPDLVPAAQTFLPTAHDRLTYQDMYAEYTKLHGILKGLYARLNGR